MPDAPALIAADPHVLLYGAVAAALLAILAAVTAVTSHRRPTAGPDLDDEAIAITRPVCGTCGHIHHGTPARAIGRASVVDPLEAAWALPAADPTSQGDHR